MVQKHYQPFRNEQGFVLVLSLVLMILITLFGVWALQTSDFENKVAGNAQLAARQFNLSEGAAYTIAAQVGSSQTSGYTPRSEWFYPKDLCAYEKIMEVREFDPTGRSRSTDKKYDSGDENTWPWSNLNARYKKDGTVDTIPDDDTLDYRYLVTYIKPTNPGQGFDASGERGFSGYTFRIQGNMANRTMVVETGGRKIGRRNDCGNPES